MINLKKMFNFDDKFYKAVGKETIKRHVSMVRNKGLGHDSQKLAKYTTRYKNDKKAGKYGGSGKYLSGNVNLSLTGGMLDDISLLSVEENGFTYGAKTEKEAEKLNAHAKGIFGKNSNPNSARIISSDKHPIPERIGVMILKEFGKEAARNISKEIRKNNFGKKTIKV